MKMIRSKKTLSGIAAATLFLTCSLSLYALESSARTSVRVDNNGIMNSIKAEVTSVTGNIINAVTHFKEKALNLIITTSGTTTIITNDSATSSLAEIRTGDIIKVTGAVTSSGSTSTAVSAIKIKAFDSRNERKIKYGMVHSINAANNTFVLKTYDNEFIFVKLSTVTKMHPANTTLYNLPIGSPVVIKGTIENGPEGQIMTASWVMGKMDRPSNNDAKRNERDKERNNRHIKEGYKSGLYFGFDVR